MYSTKPVFLPASNDISRQAKFIIIASIDVAHQFVDVGMVTLRRQGNGLFKGFASRQEAAETEEGTATQTETRKINDFHNFKYTWLLMNDFVFDLVDIFFFFIKR